MALPPELDFLAPFYEDPSVSLKSVDWLLSKFEADQWHYSFEYKEPKTIDWAVQLDDGSCLTDNKNRNLLSGLKYYLTSSTTHHSKSATKSNIVRSREFNRALNIVDFILLNSEQFKLARYGLGGLGRDALKLILDEIGSNNDTAESVYGWSKRLSLFCLKLVLDTDPSAIRDTLTDHPELVIITPEQIDNNNLDIPVEAIPNVRAALYLNNYYRNASGGKSPNSASISNKIYRNTLKGRFETKPTPTMLFVHNESFVRECLPIPVTTGVRERMGISGFRDYRSSLYALGILHELGLPAPSPEDLIAAKGFNNLPTTSGRFRTLPSHVVFGAVKDAIEFHIKHGDNIINGWCRVVLHCKKNNLSLSEFNDNELIKVIGKDLIELGVCRLGLSRRTAETPVGNTIKGPRSVYFDKLRANHGLVELVKIYVGCTQVVVGSIMGRRVGELLDLHTTNCLDTSEQWLVFLNRKSTYRLFGTRKIEARPIEPIAVQMIKRLIRLQRILLRIGCINEMKELFSSPYTRYDMVFTSASITTYNQNLDLFCDYFKTETNKDGRRYYIRQHQLRRFFAMLFFYSSSFGGLETLQWMLGHTDVTHVWHYITEAMDGATLRGAKAQFVAEALHNGDVASYENLAALIKSKYGTDNFTVVDTDELENYLLDLMEDGSIEIEPEFFEDNDGQKFKVIAKVNGVTT